MRDDTCFWKREVGFFWEQPALRRVPLYAVCGYVNRRKWGALPRQDMGAGSDAAVWPLPHCFSVFNA